MRSWFICQVSARRGIYTVAGVEAGRPGSPTLLMNHRSLLLCTRVATFPTLCLPSHWRGLFPRTWAECSVVARKPGLLNADFMEVAQEKRTVTFRVICMKSDFTRHKVSSLADDASFVLLWRRGGIYIYIIYMLYIQDFPFNIYTCTHKVLFLFWVECFKWICLFYPMTFLFFKRSPEKCNFKLVVVFLKFLVYSRGCCICCIHIYDT